MTENASTSAELAALITRHCPEDGLFATPVPGLVFFRMSSPNAPVCSVVKSIFLTAAQGAKRISLADETYVYDASHYLITSVGLPLIGQVIDATPDKPYLSLGLELDPLKISELMQKMPPARPSSAGSVRGLGVGVLSPSISEALLRLARLVDNPEHIAVLAPLIEQELLYHLLAGDQGGRLRDVAIKGSQTHRVARAIHWVNENFKRPMAIDELAATVTMSRASLHQHFKALTSMSPLQYQKTLRLQEARRLMLVDQIDAATASHRVGYESPSQFNREYRRMFGAPPHQDMVQIRQAG
ncbi:MAG: AraC family transcriptional regulator [Betaproteobacteria bacterium HGW-Betaproteobacteria-12]|nr:MAG: AraC family transcriptional regulator [Betaproteobacteria bacterium HGW-Betaproteobacteria-12]